MTLLAGLIQPPLEGRSPKPRSGGLTMIMDKGLSVVEMTSLLDQCAEYIDFIKLAFGTLALYPPKVLHQKIELARQYRIPIYPGGTFLEIAYWEKQIDSCLPKLQALGIEWLEISDGTLSIPVAERAALIKKGAANGFHILTEVGKKNTAHQPNAVEIAQQALGDLENGAYLVIIEARESGTGIGIYDQHGQIEKDKFAFLKDVLPSERILWEAPLKSQQSELINCFGPNVNIGNLAPSEVLALEALRQGLRSDTWLPRIKKISR